MIGQLCACDMDNFGDVLYPIIFKNMVEKHGLTSKVIPLGFLEGPAPARSNYFIHGINSVIRSSAQDFSHLVIGGGDLLRTDREVLANHYCEIGEQHRKRRLRYRFEKLLLGKRHIAKQGTKRREEFVRKFMNYSPLGPYILNRRQYSGLRSLVYCSCGIPFRFPHDKSSEIKEAFEAASFIYVRDVSSRNKLLEIGVDRHVEASPDLIVTISDFFDKDAERLKGVELLKKTGIDISRKIICFQSNPQSPEEREELFLQLTSLQKWTGAEIVLLPIGYCHGDDKFLKKLAKRSFGALKYFGSHSIFDTISVVAACNAFVGTSMHGNIVAFSFGIPHLFGPIAVDKAEGFLNIVGLGPGFKLDSWAHMADKCAMLDDLPRDYVQARAKEAKSKVYASFEKMACVLKNKVLQ